MFVCCECCVLSGRGLCDELITRPEESYRLWCVMCVISKNLLNEEAITRVGLQRHIKKKSVCVLYLLSHFTHAGEIGSVVYTHVRTFAPTGRSHDLLSQGTQRYPLIASPGQPGGWTLRLDWKLMPNRCVQEKFYQYHGRINNRQCAHCRCGQHSQNCERDVIPRVFSTLSTVTTKCQPARLLYLASKDSNAICQFAVFPLIGSASDGSIIYV
jgi:hypothetical protein